MSQWLLAAIAAIVAPALAYLAAARKASGRIETTEASELWGEAAKIRQEYRDDIGQLRELVTHLRERIAQLDEDNSRLFSENEQLLKRIHGIENSDQAPL